MTTKHLRPAEGRKIRDPRTGIFLPPEGRKFPWEPGSPNRSYWLRALAAGDVVEAHPLTVPVPDPTPDPED